VAGHAPSDAHAPRVTYVSAAASLPKSPSLCAAVAKSIKLRNLSLHLHRKEAKLVKMFMRCAAVGALLAAAAVSARPEVLPVPSLELLRYAGRWYQGE
jgi:hypothetical protein